MPHTPAPQATANDSAEHQAALTVKASFGQDMLRKMRSLGPIAYRPLGHYGLLAALFVGFSSAYAQSSLPVQPELPSARLQKAAFKSSTFAVAAANPLATQAGYEILRAGGSAVDAAIAVQMVLGVVEPQSSGIGGGGFLLHFDGKKTQAFDGREAAPSAARPHLFLDANGAPMPFEQAAIGGRAVGIPGLVRMLTMAQQQHGRLGWAKLFAPAIRIATEGFPISERMATLLAADKSLRLDPVASAYFYDRQGKPWPQGHVLTNPELAAVLTRIASEGSNALMLGELPLRMADVVRKHPTNPGTLAPLDMSNYRAFVREPLCFDYPVPAQQREYRICGMPPPSSGQLAIGQILGTLRALGELPPALQDGQPTPDWMHAYTEAARLALADRQLYVGDPSFVVPPGGSWSRLLEPAYLTKRARLINLNGPRMDPPKAGDPTGTIKSMAYAAMPAQIENGTSHISIVDGYGNAVAMTSSIEAAWGAHIMVNRGVGLVGGFLLNNQLTDFSFIPNGPDGKPIANRVEPTKRPRSSMSPTLVFDKATGKLVLSGGSPGGALIIHFTAKLLLGTLDWGLSPQEAIDLPNFSALDEVLLLESGGFPASTVAALAARGHKVQQVPLTSGIQAIQRNDAGWSGGADPRREGVVLGD
jgi:gamma-glutamyltranspeptidase/glutathione hydrolase